MVTPVAKGLFITFEGTEGSGKSTLIQLVSKVLKTEGCAITQTREPGGSPLSEKIRTLVLGTPMDPRTELLLYEAARAEHLATVIKPALSRGEFILCDRFTASTLAYQAHARGLPWKEVQTLNKIATSGLCPDLIILLNIDPATGLRRAREPNRFEEEGVNFQKKVRAGYLKARSENPSQWFTLDVKNHSPEELCKAVIKRIKKQFKNQFQDKKHASV